MNFEVEQQNAEDMNLLMMVNFSGPGTIIDQVCIEFTILHASYRNKVKSTQAKVDLNEVQMCCFNFVQLKFVCVTSDSCSRGFPRRVRNNKHKGAALGRTGWTMCSTFSTVHFRNHWFQIL